MKLQGWRAMGAGLVAGALAALAMPPLYWLPLAVVGIVAFVWLWRRAPTAAQRLLARPGPGASAISPSAPTGSSRPSSCRPPTSRCSAPPIVRRPGGVCSVLFPGLAAWASHAARRCAGRRSAAATAGWSCWRSPGPRPNGCAATCFTGYPWNPLGHVWAFATPLLQGAALVGVYGLGTLTFIVLAAPTAGWRAADRRPGGIVGLAGLLASRHDGRGRDRRRAPMDPHRAAQCAAGREVAAREPRPRAAAKLVELSRRDGLRPLAAVVWPETAPPFDRRAGLAGARDAGDGRAAAAAICWPARRAHGTVVRGRRLELAAGDRRGAGAIVATYDKVHLVPLGEYIPFHKQLAPVSGLIGRGSFEEGEARVTISLPGLPSFSPVICYEVIFPRSRHRSRRAARAGC